MLGALTFEIRVTFCRNVLEREQIEASESRFASNDVLVPADKLWKDLNLSGSVLFRKAFRLQPDCERVSDFATQQHRPISEYKFTELGLSAGRPFERLNRTFT